MGAKQETPEGGEVPGVSIGDLVAKLKRCPHCSSVFGKDDGPHLEYVFSGSKKHRVLCTGCYCFMERSELRELVIAWNTRGGKIPEDIPDLSKITVGVQREPSPF